VISAGRLFYNVDCRIVETQLSLSVVIVTTCIVECVWSLSSLYRESYDSLFTSQPSVSWVIHLLYPLQVITAAVWLVWSYRFVLESPIVWTSCTHQKLNMCCLCMILTGHDSLHYSSCHVVIHCQFDGTNTCIISQNLVNIWAWNQRTYVVNTRVLLLLIFGSGVVQYWDISEAHRSKHSLCACQPQ